MKYNASCSEFTNHKRMIMGISEVTANAVSVVACAFVILIIVTYKKYQFSLQKLLLHLTIIFMAYSTLHCVQGASYKIVTTQENYCKALGFLILYLLLCARVTLTCIVLDVYLCVVLRKDTTRMKWIYLAAIYLIPAGVTWIPFVFDLRVLNVPL